MLNCDQFKVKFGTRKFTGKVIIDNSDSCAVGLTVNYSDLVRAMYCSTRIPLGLYVVGIEIY